MMVLKLIKHYISLIYWSKQPIDKVRRMQLKKFKEVFEYAREYSPFYHDLYTKAGIMDLDIKTWDDVEKVPVVDKNVFRQAPLSDRLTCPIDDSKLNIHYTSGSSGNPMQIAYEKWVDYTGHVRVFYMLWKIAHYTPFSKILMIARYEKNDSFQIEKEISLLKKIQKHLKLFRREIISIYSSPDEIIDSIIKIKPKILWATPSVIEIVCNRLVDRKITIEIPFLYLTSEGVSVRQFKLFQTNISKNIISHYGAMESPSIGYYYNDLNIARVFENACLIEYLNRYSDEKSEFGTIVITSLLNKANPFVRYNIGDYGNILQRGDFPNRHLGSVIGRNDDILVFPDGKCFFHHQAHEMYMDFKECRHFKFIQSKDGIITMQLICASGYAENQVGKLAIERWNKRFSMYPLKIEFVDNIEIDKITGKVKNMQRLS